MRFLPMAPSAHPSAWAIEPDETGREEFARQVFERDNHTCRFCGHRAVNWQAVFHLDGDHDNWTLENLVTACTLCHGGQHLGRPTVCEEMMLIWQPDISQAALNCIVRRIHLTLHAHGEPAYMGQTPRVQNADVYAALRAYHGLAAEAVTLERRIHTSDPRHLGAALLTFQPSERGQLPGALGGIRLLHRGRFYVRGRDLYPGILRAWS